MEMKSKLEDFWGIQHINDLNGIHIELFSSFSHTKSMSQSYHHQNIQDSSIILKLLQVLIPLSKNSINFSLPFQKQFSSIFSTQFTSPFTFQHAPSSNNLRQESKYNCIQEINVSDNDKSMWFFFYIKIIKQKYIIAYPYP